MASISSASSDSSDYFTATESDNSSSESDISSRRNLQVQRELAHRKIIEVRLSAWEAVSFPCLYPSEQVVALEEDSSFNTRCKASIPGRPLDDTASWLFSTVVIPSQDEVGLLASLFAELPEISRTTSRRREFAHQILLTLAQNSCGSLAKLFTIPYLMRKCITALKSIQRYNISSLNKADYVDLRLTLYRLSVAAIWQRTQQLAHRVSIAYHYILRDQEKVVLVLSYKPGALFTRLREATFDQVLHSAQESLVFEPLFEEDWHGFKVQPKLDDIHWKEE